MFDDEVRPEFKHSKDKLCRCFGTVRKGNCIQYFRGRSIRPNNVCVGQMTCSASNATSEGTDVIGGQRVTRFIKA